MAYQYTDYSGYGNETDEETRKRRAMMMAGLGGDSSLGDMASNMFTNRLDQAQANINGAANMFSNPEEELKKRMGIQPVAPTVPTEQQVAQQAQPFIQQLEQYKPVQPESIVANQPMPDIGQPPTPGPGTHFAGPATIGALNRPIAPTVPTQQEVEQQAQPFEQQLQQYRATPQAGEQPMNRGMQPSVSPTAFAPTVERQVEPLTQGQLHNQMVIDARNEQDPVKRKQNYAKLIADPNVDEGVKTLANRFIAEDYFKQESIKKANDEIEKATPTDLARYMREQTKEGSYIKAILFARLGLNDLAQKEQEKLDPTITMASAVDGDGNKYTVGRDKNGNITTGFDVTGRQVGQETLAKLSAAAMPTKAHLMPSVHGSPVVNSKGEVGTLMYDPQSQSNYVQVGKERRDTTGWTSMAQNVSNVYNAAAAKVGGEAAGAGLTPPTPAPMPGENAVQRASRLGVPIVSGVRDEAKQQQLWDESVRANRTGYTASGNPIARPGTSAHQNANAVDIDTNRLTADDRKKLTDNGFYQPYKNDPNHWELRPEATTKVPSIPEQKAAIETQAEVNKARLKPPAEEAGKQEAKNVAKQGFADSTYPLLQAVREEISKSTGSKIGAGVDELANVIGASTKGQEAIMKLNVLAGPIKMNIPRFEGAQSDRDVQEYARQAGDFANPKLPVKARLAALDAMETLLKKYDKAGNNDWTFGRGQQEKTIDGVTYVYDGKGWKRK